MKEQKEELQRELQELSPLLAKWKAENRPEGFDLPPGYFRQLPGEVLQRLSGSEQAGARKWWSPVVQALANLFQPRFAIGAATVALLIVTGIMYRHSNASEESDPFAGLSTEEIGRYIDNNLEKFDEQLVIEATTHSPDLSIFPSTVTEEDSLDEHYLQEFLDDLDTKTLEELL